MEQPLGRATKERCGVGVARENTSGPGSEAELKKTHRHGSGRASKPNWPYLRRALRTGMGSLN